MYLGRKSIMSRGVASLVIVLAVLYIAALVKGDVPPTTTSDWYTTTVVFAAGIIAGLLAVADELSNIVKKLDNIQRQGDKG